jgi:hypothetical protein
VVISAPDLFGDDFGDGRDLGERNQKITHRHHPSKIWCNSTARRAIDLISFIPPPVSQISCSMYSTESSLTYDRLNRMSSRLY